MKSFNQKIIWKSKIDDEVKFKFNVFNPLIDGAIFSAFVLFLPISVLIFLRFHFNYGVAGINSESFNELLQVCFITLQIVSCALGVFILFKRDNQLFLKTSAFGIFLFILVPFLFVMLLGSLISTICKPFFTNQTIFQTFLAIILQLIAEILVGIIMLSKVVDLKERILQTLKREKTKIIFMTFLVGTFLITISLFIKSQTENQSQLTSILDSSNKVVVVMYAILLFIFSVIVAPLIEELACRDSIFTGVGNKWLGLFVSSTFFAMMHVSGNGDLENIWIYLIPGIFFSLTFIYTDGNVTYPWMLHTANNFIAFILIIVAIGA